MNVHAIGRNIFPSMPSSVSTGAKTSVMMPIPNTMGRTTRALDFAIDSSRSEGESFRPSSRWRSFSERRFASVMTTEPSTRMPKSIAPRLSKLAAIANSYIPCTANSIEIGIATATSRPARMLPKMTSNTTITSTAPITRLCSTVLMTCSTSRVRS